MKKIKISVGGMHCGSCALAIQMVLENLEGVSSSSASYENKTAEAEFDENKVSVDQIIKAIRELNYKAEIIG